MRLADIAQKLGCRLEGPPEIEIRGVAGIEHAEAGQITFLANRRYFPLLKTTRASAVFLEEGISLDPEASPPSPAPLRSANPDPAFAHAHAVVREFCRIGNRVILQNGVVIGGDGLGFAKQKDGTWYKMTQSGPAVLEDDVEVQANACVDRATVGETRIGRGSKLDDLVLIGHASQVGANTMLCGQVGLARSTKVGSNCILAGQVGTAGHLTVGDGAVITAQSGVPNDVPPRSLYSGYPAVENREWLKTMAALNRLPELQKRVRELEAEIARLQRP